MCGNRTADGRGNTFSAPMARSTVSCADMVTFPVCKTQGQGAHSNQAGIRARRPGGKGPRFR
ncbi:hypothetical protein KH5H1_21040 [Corallococcus caeni]|nr:hypothetical protein KH5H1_21040 [Corallococcus sp. KH5-1]